MSLGDSGGTASQKKNGPLMRLRFFVSLFLAVGLTLAAPLFRPAGLLSSAYAETVRRVVVEGNQRIESETVLSYLQLGAGNTYDVEKVDESIKALFQTGLFSDVQIDMRNGTLVVRVEENPMINRVNFEGNSEINDDALAKEVELRERMMFTRARVQSDMNRVIALYKRTGYNSVRVSPKIIRLPQNRVDLVFEIQEGGETVIRSIDFVGNEAFSDGDLRGVMVSEENAWWKFMSKNDTYDPDRLEYDKELIRRYYLKNGFADVRVVSADAQLSPDGEYFDIVITVEEGPRYSIADVAVNVGDADLDADGLRRVIKTGVGDDYDATRIDKTVENLTLEATKQGYIFAKVEPQIDRNPDQGSLNVTYNIVEGARTYIERIEIIGNTRTLDVVIRRELRLYEGDAFNRVLVDRARRRLTALDFFEKIDIREDPGSAPDKVVLVVDVIEKSTGQLSFSVGYSTTDTIIGSVGLTERNLMGRGQNVKLNTTLSFKKQQIDFSFTEPYFMGMPIAAGFDLFALKADNSEYSSYKSNAVGGALRAGFRLDEYSSLTFRYSISRREVEGVSTSASPAVQAREGVTWKSAVGSTYTWDDLDNPNRPTNGFRGQIETEIAGLGGDTYYGRIEGHAWYFYPVYEESVILKLEANAGHIEAFPGEIVPLQDRYFMGGDTFRGFYRSGVGPRQNNNTGGTDAIGGQTYAIGTVEMVFPLYGIPDEWGLEGAVFSDFGTVFNAPEVTVAETALGPCNNGDADLADPCTVFDDASFRASIGAGLIWQSPFGPLRFEVAYPLLKQDYDEVEYFRFSIGTRF